MENGQKLRLVPQTTIKRDVTLETAHLVGGDRVVLQKTRSDCEPM
jgi:hypothetical protein